MGGSQGKEGLCPCYGVDEEKIQVGLEQNLNGAKNGVNETTLGGISLNPETQKEELTESIILSTKSKKNIHCKLCEFEVKFIKSGYKKFYNSWQKMHPFVLEFKQYLTVKQYQDHYFRANVMIEADDWLSKLEEECYKQFGLSVEPFTRLQNIIAYTEPPLAILHDDLVGNMVNSHYQLVISQSRYKMRPSDNLENIKYSLRKLIIPDQLEYLVTKQSQQKSLTLDCVIYILKNCYCKYFKPNLNYEYIFFNRGESQQLSLFSFVLSLYKQMAHMAYNFRYIFLTFVEERAKDDYYKIITVYNYMYTCYMEVAFSINQKYSELGDHIQNLYSEIVYGDNELPHFRLITAFVKFWAVIFLQNKVWEHLIRSWRAVQRKKPIQFDALNELVASIIDVSYNQISIHWLGDCRQNNAPNTLMLHFIEVYIQETVIYYNTLLDQPPEDCYKALDEDLMIQRKIFPTWFVDCHVEPIVLNCKYIKIQTLMYNEVDALIQSENSEFFKRSKILKKQPKDLFEEIIMSTDNPQVGEQQQQQKEQKLEGFLQSGLIGESSDIEKFVQTKESQTQDDITAIFLKTSQSLYKSYSELKNRTNNDTYMTVLTAASTNGQGVSFIDTSGLIPHYIKPNEGGLELARQIPPELKAQLQQIRNQQDINIAKRFERLESQTLRAKYYKIQEGRKANLLNYLKPDILHDDIKQTKAQNSLKASLIEFFKLNIINLVQRMDEIKADILKQGLDNNQQQKMMNEQLKDIEYELNNLTQYVQDLEKERI